MKHTHISVRVGFFRRNASYSYTLVYIFSLSRYSLVLVIKDNITHVYSFEKL
jgi:hypothetical protein